MREEWKFHLPGNQHISWQGAITVKARGGLEEVGALNKWAFALHTVAKQRQDVDAALAAGVVNRFWKNLVALAGAPIEPHLAGDMLYTAYQLYEGHTDLAADGIKPRLKEVALAGCHLNIAKLASAIATLSSYAEKTEQPPKPATPNFDSVYKLSEIAVGASRK